MIYKDKKFSFELFDQMPVVGILRNISFTALQEILPIYQAIGFTTIEITLNTPQAQKMLTWANKAFGESLNIGAGTICTLADLELALEAGAQFIVTPILNPEVILNCVEAKIPIFSGAFSPTEVYNTWQLGASAVKVFPSSLGQLDYIKALLGPLDKVKLIPTGGVNLANFQDYMNIGAYGLGMGGELFPKKILENEAWEDLKQHLQDFYQAFQAWKTK